MRVLVTGAAGMLGSDVVDELRSRGHEAVVTDLAELDITDPTSVAQIGVGALGPLDWCINCAAYTAVDKAEEEERLAMEVNSLAVGYLGRACLDGNVRLLHISTDFVFDGVATTPYEPEAEPNPLSVYGRSKLAGERALSGNPRALVVRTAWLYGPRGKSFPRTIVGAYRSGKPLRVVGDQFGNPTYTGDLARVLVDLAGLDPFPGIYHAVGPETMSWHEFACLAVKTCTGELATIESIPTSSWPTPAKRPAYSVLSMKKTEALGIAPMRPVAEAMADLCRRGDLR